MQQFNVGDVVRLSKRHPCGSAEWVIMRVGADVGIKCLGCRRRVMLERADFEKRLEEVLATWDEAFGTNGQPPEKED